MSYRKFLRYLICAVVLSSFSSVVFAWRFVSIADTRGSNNGVNTDVLAKIVERINAEKVDLVIIAGDLVDGSSQDAVLASQFDTWKSVMSKLTCPYYIAVGNHEMASSNSEKMIRSKFDMPKNGPSGCEGLVYSFDHENAHFVCLDSYKENQDHKLQLAWMKSDLAATRKLHVFVFAHDPAYPKGPHIGSSLDVFPAERDDFWHALAVHGCRMYFTGHEHLYSRDEKDGVMQVINGSAGAPIVDGVPGTIAKYHYVLVNVNGGTISCQAKDENGKPFDSWSYTIVTNGLCASKLENGAIYSFTNRAVTRVDGSVFYVLDRCISDGLRVNSAATSVTVGDKVNIFGKLETVDGKRVLSGYATKIQN